MERADAHKLLRWECPTCSFVNDLDENVFESEVEVEANCDGCGDLVVVDEPA